MKKMLMASTLVVALLLLGTSCGNRAVPQVHTGFSTADTRGYAAAEVTRQGDKITQVRLQEFDGLGREKDWATYPYSVAKEALDHLAKAFVAKNGSGVDAFTGATSSSEKFIEAVSFALQRANNPAGTGGQYFDGTFMGSSDATERGWGVAWVTLQDDVIVEVQLLDTMSGQDASGRATFVLKAPDGENRYTYEPYHVARIELAEAIVKQGSTQVDSVTGATGSYTGWLQAVERALEKAHR